MKSKTTWDPSQNVTFSAVTAEDAQNLHTFKETEQENGQRTVQLININNNNKSRYSQKYFPPTHEKVS